MTRVILELDSSEKLSKLEIFAKQEEIRIVKNAGDEVSEEFRNSLEKILVDDREVFEMLAQ
jgi:hypothetical protein